MESYFGSVHWYRKDFKAPRGAADSKWVFRFESVNYRAKVWLNGKPLGTHVGAYLPFEVRAKDIRRRGVNRLVVRVDGRRQKFDIPPLSVSEHRGLRGRLVELHRHPARGLPAARSRISTSRTFS